MLQLKSVDHVVQWDVHATAAARGWAVTVIACQFCTCGVAATQSDQVLVCRYWRHTGLLCQTTSIPAECPSQDPNNYTR